jgi:hypothetical protein
MDTLKIRRKDLLAVRKDLKKASKSFDPLLNSIEPCLLNEDWELIHNIEDTLLKSLQRIDYLIMSARNFSIKHHK